jgi:hypothetical protein
MEASNYCRVSIYQMVNLKSSEESLTPASLDQSLKGLLSSTTFSFPFPFTTTPFVVFAPKMLENIVSEEG